MELNDQSKTVTFKFKCKETVIDIVTGIRGVVTARTDYITGQPRYSVETISFNTGTGFVESVSVMDFDEDRLASFEMRHGRNEISEEETKS